MEMIRRTSVNDFSRTSTHLLMTGDGGGLYYHDHNNHDPEPDSWLEAREEGAFVLTCEQDASAPSATFKISAEVWYDEGGKFELTITHCDRATALRAALAAINASD